MSSERLDEGSCADTQQMGQATNSPTPSKKLVPTDKGAKKKTSFWEKVSKTFRKSGKKDAEVKNLEDESNLEKTLDSYSNAGEDNSTLDASAVNIGGAGEVSIVGANIGTLNYYMTPATGFQDAPSISESADEQRKEKSDVLNLGRGTNVFLNKVLYEDGNGSVKIYEGEFPKFEGVYKAAVKFLPYSKNAKREAESVEKIRSHKYVVGIFETGINESSPMNGYIYISMERCSKMTLYDYVIESRCLDQQQALNHSMQIISGLEYIHGFKIAHRDLKPHNILFVDDGRFEQIKIADFGMSKNYLVDSSVTVGGKIGTKGYSAPELIRHKTPKDPLKCDIFSLGILIAFRISNGKHPYGEEDCDWEYNIAHGGEPDLNEIHLNSELRSVILPLIRKMLEFNPDNRPTASSFRQDWERDVKSLRPSAEFGALGKKQDASLSQDLKRELLKKGEAAQEVTDIEVAPLNMAARDADIQGRSQDSSHTSRGQQVQSDERPTPTPQGIAAFEDHRHEEPKMKKFIEVRKPTPLTFDVGRDCKILKGGEYALEINPIKPGTHVYRGMHRIGPTNQPIIGKMIHSPEEHEKEIDILVTLQNHENVMKVLDSAKDESHYNYIILEDCKADTLHDIMKRGRQLNLSQMWLYTKQLVEGMKFIHANNVIHWDLKPENIFFSHTGQLKIGDFGLSKQLDFGRSKKTNIDAGTDGWRAPETYSANKIDKKSDIFSLGLVFYFIWANGKHPFGIDIHDWCYNIKKDLNCDLTLLLLPDGTKKNHLLSLLKRMLDSDRANRPTMEDIAQDSFFQEELLDPIFETIKEIDENLSAPLSTAEYIGSEECEVSIMGCKLLFAKMPSEETSLVYVGVRPISDDVPNGKFAISPEVECEIFKSSCERQVTICLPLQALPDEKGLSVLEKVDANSDWGVLSWKCEDPDEILEDRYVKLQIPIQKSIKILVTCSEIQTQFAKHFLYSKNQQQCRIMCLDSEALITRLHDIFERENFNKSEIEIPITDKLQAGERLIYPYKYKFAINPLPLEKQIIIQEDEFVKIYHRLVPPFKTRVTEGVQTSLQEQNGTKSEECLSPLTFLHKVPYINIKRSAKSFFEEKNKSSSNENYFVYPDRPKGVVLIINNETRNIKHRKGSREDMKLQLALWKDLGFDVIPGIDLNAEDMRIACEDLATKASENRVSIVVVVIMSHGHVENEKEAFAGEDDDWVYLDDVVSPFIKTLKGIPKLFMFQACRVKLRDERCAPPTVKTIYRCAFCEPPDDEADAIAEISGAAGEEDMLFAYPCRVGEYSYRSTKSGSRMMQAVAKVFMQHAHNTDVLTMLTMVNDAISKMDEEETIQRSCQNSLMRKKLYLFPGWLV